MTPAAIITRPYGSEQPTRPVELDLNNPLAQGLIFDIGNDFARPYIDPVGGYMNPGIRPGVAMDVDGEAIQFSSGAANGTYWEWPCGNIALSEPWCMLADVTRIGTIASGTVATIISFGYSSNDNNNISLSCMGATYAARWRYRTTSDMVGTSDSAGTFDLGVRRQIALVGRGGSDRSRFFDVEERHDNTTALAAFNVNSATYRFRIGYLARSSQGDQAKSLMIRNVRIYNRNVDQDELRELKERPYVLYRPRKLVVYSFAGGVSPVYRDAQGDWDVRAEVARDASTAFELLNTTARDAVSSFDMRTEVQRDAAAAFDTEARVLLDAPSAYDMAGMVSADVPAAFDMLSRAFGDAASAWQVLQSVVGDVAASFDLRTEIASDVGAAYDLRTRINHDAPSSYDLAGPAGQVASDAMASFDLRGQAMRDAQAVFDLRNQVQRDASSSFSVQARVQSDAGAAFDLRMIVVGDVASSYGVLNNVSRDAVSSFDLRSRVIRDAQAAFDIIAAFGQVVSDCTMAYDVGGRVVADAQAVFDVLEEIAADIAARYDVRVRVAQGATCAYDTASRIDSDAASAFDLAGTVFRDAASAYRVGDAPPPPSNPINIYLIPAEGRLYVVPPECRH